VALQGTIDAFPLTDVLQLLSSSTRSGRLMLDGDRGHADLWLNEGSVVGGESTAPSDSAALLVFEMLRFTDGSFVFDGPVAPDAAPSRSVVPATLDECLVEAASLLEEWSRIEAVLPSQQHVIRLAAELPTPSITVSADEWRLLATLGTGTRAAQLAEGLGRGEFDTSSLIVAMVERSLLVIDPPASEEMAVSPRDPVEHRQDVTAATSDEFAAGENCPSSADPENVVTEDPSFPERFPIDDLLGDEASSPGGAWPDGPSEGSRLAAAQSLEPLGAEAFSRDALAGPDPSVQGRTADAWDDVVAGFDPVEQRPTGLDPSTAMPDDQPGEVGGAGHGSDDTADEVLRQMSRLSPKAAEAIAAALNTPAASAPEAEGPIDPGDGNGPITYLGSF